jgi:hypothetical protein
VSVNEPLIYFLAGRLPATLYHQFDPGVTTTLEAQREIVGGLIRHRVEYVVISTESDADFSSHAREEPRDGVRFLDDYLRSHYRPVRRFGLFHTVARRSAAWEGRAPVENP